MQQLQSMENSTSWSPVQVTHSGTGQGVLHNALHLGLNVVLPKAFLGTAGIQMLGKLGAGPHVALGPVTCTTHS